MRSFCKPALSTFALLFLCLGSVLSIGHAQNQDSTQVTTRQQITVASYARLPLTFEANIGQTDRRVKFMAHTAGGTLFLTDTEAVLALPKRPISAKGRKPFYSLSRADKTGMRPTKVAVLRMKLAGAHQGDRVAGMETLPGIVNYFRGNNPAQWRTNIPTYRKARFADVYRGVDIVYYGAQDGRLEYDFVVKPGANPKQIKLAFEGAQRVWLTPEGDLALETEAGAVRWHRPVTYQVINGRHEEVACSYRLEHNGGKTEALFAIAHYDSRRPLIVDPVMAYSTYLGGTVFDIAAGIAVDAAGNAYVASAAISPDFPVTLNALQRTTKTEGGYTNCISKLNPTGTALIYSTYVGGNVDDGPGGIAIDDAGNAYVTGITFSFDYPVTQNAYQHANHTNVIGGANGYITKLDSTGSKLLYSTYFGGSGIDVPRGVALDIDGNAYITGYTSSIDFPVTPNAFQTFNGVIPVNSSTGFVTKLNSTGTALIYSTFLGGSTNDTPSSIAVDRFGYAYITGSTDSVDFPVTTFSYEPTNKTKGEGFTGFVTKLDSTGSDLIYSTYLGGTGAEAPTSLAIDLAGNAYVAGFTYSHDYPVTANAFQTRDRSFSFIGFVTKLNAFGSALLYSTYLGGTAGDLVGGIAVDTVGEAYVTGYTYSFDFPVTLNADQSLNRTRVIPGANAFVTKLNAAGSSLVYSSYLGGTGSDGDYGYDAIALDLAGNAVVTGSTLSLDFPITPGAFQTINRARVVEGRNLYVAKYNLASPMISRINPAQANVGSSTFVLTVTGNHFAPGAKVLWNHDPLTTTYSSSTQLNATVPADDLVHRGAATVMVLNTDGGISNVGVFIIVMPPPIITIHVSNVAFDALGGMILTVDLQNRGGNVDNLKIIGATLSPGSQSTASPLPIFFTSDSEIFLLYSRLPDFTNAELRVNGTYNGGAFNASTRFDVP